MKKFARLVQCDSRGQIVIPKEVRQELGIEEGAGFYLYVIENEGILLKTIPSKEFSEHTHMIKEIEVNAEKISVSKKNLDASVQNYKKKERGNLQRI